MKLWEVMRLLEENPRDVYETSLNDGWKVRVTVKQGFDRYYNFEVLNGKRVIGGAFDGNIALGLEWQLVQQPVTWQEAIEAWADGKKVSFSYRGNDKRFPFEDSNTMMSVEKVKRAEWYVEVTK